MDEHAWLAERFEEHRTRLRAVAYRMLGSLAEADEAVQDAWLRVSRLGAGEIDNPGKSYANGLLGIAARRLRGVLGQGCSPKFTGGRGSEFQ